MATDYDVSSAARFLVEGYVHGRAVNQPFATRADVDKLAGEFAISDTTVDAVMQQLVNEGRLGLDNGLLKPIPRVEINLEELRKLDKATLTKIVGKEKADQLKG